MSDFTPEPVILNPGDLAEEEVQFFEVDGYPVVYVNDGKKGVSGAVALDGENRTFPVASLFSYAGCELGRDEFLVLFPAVKMYFEPLKKAAA